jgi:putative phosphoesterase
MRFAVISDIHGNRLALEAVLDDIAKQGTDGILNLGDHLSGPIDPAGTASILSTLGSPAIAGNHDRWLIERAPHELGPVDQFVASQISAVHRDWLKALPASAVVSGEVFLCHGTPRSDNTPWLDAFWHDRRTELPTEQAVTEEADGFDFPVLLCGHTHWARTVRLRDGRLIVNPGSVGLQFIHGAPDARYAIVERSNSNWSVSFRMVCYDHSVAARQATKNGFAYWREALMTGWADPDELF